MSTAPVTAIIVSYRSRASIPAALEVARASHERGLLDCIVVDNDGTDGTADYVRSEHPWARVVESGANLGFGRGCNLGIAESRSPYVLLLNPDAVLPAEGLEALHRFLEQNPRAGLVGPAILEPQGRLQQAGGLLTPVRLVLGAAGRQLPRRSVEPGAAPFRTDWLCGAILLIRRRALEELGGFDPRFFLYYEETDLCRRALEAGWELWAVGEAVGRHTLAASSDADSVAMVHGCIAEHYYRSRFYYLVKHHGWPAAAAAELGDIALLAARALCRKLLGRGGEAVLRERLRAPVLRQPEKI